MLLINLIEFWTRVNARHNWDNKFTSVWDRWRLAPHCFNPASRLLYRWRGSILLPFVFGSPDPSPRTDLLTARTAGLFSGSATVGEDYTTLPGVPVMPHIPDSPVAEASLSSVCWTQPCDSRRVHCQTSSDASSWGWSVWPLSVRKCF